MILEKLFFLPVSQMKKTIKELRKIMLAKTFFHLFLSHKHRREKNLGQT